MFKILDLKYYTIEVNDESKEIKCIQIVIYKKSNPRKKMTLLEFFKQILNFLYMFWNWKESQSSIWLW